jgi:hypothetical protein
MELLAFPETEDCSEGWHISDIVNIQVCDSHPAEHSRTGVPGLQQCIAQ